MFLIPTIPSDKFCKFLCFESSNFWTDEFKDYYTCLALEKLELLVDCISNFYEPASDGVVKLRSSLFRIIIVGPPP